MAYKLQANFAGGELDPALRKRVSLNKYSTGLATARNTIIGKTGRVISRPGRKHVTACTTTSGRKVVVWPTYDGKYLEFGHNYVRAYGPDDSLLGSDTHSFDSANFANLQFLNVDSNNMNFTATRGTLVYGAGSPIFVEEDGTVQTFANWIWTPNATITFATETNGGTGYDVRYAASYVVNGQESIYALSSSATFLLPINNGEENLIKVQIPAADLNLPVNGGLEEVRFYRIPDGGGTFGFIGSSRVFTTVGTNYECTFVDAGQFADYANQPIPGVGFSFNGLTIGTYEKRLIIPRRAASAIPGTIITSRQGYPWNFSEDIPLKSDSALEIGLNSEDILVFRTIENEGLILFTSDGVYLHSGPLTPTSLGFEKIGPWTIDYRVTPISVDGGILFVDSKSNSVKQLRYFDKKAGYLADEMTIFSDHLFRENRITSWAYQRGQLPLLWVTFADGTYATFTYEETQEMRAWTRHDSGTGIEHVASVKPYVNSTTFDLEEGQLLFVVKNGDDRFIERSVNRFLTSEELETNPEADKGETIAAMDSMVSQSDLLNDDLIDDDITLTPVVADTWDGELTLAVTNDAIFPSPGDGAVGTIFRHFHPVDRTSVDLEITARTSDNEVTVTPVGGVEFPSTYATNPRLYVTFTSVTGLSHLNGEDVSVIVDGYVVGSPNNDDQDYDTYTPSSGSLTVPRAAIAHVGRPYTMDVETLDIHTVEQAPTYNESISCNRVKIETYQSRGLYVGSRFPLLNKVKGNSNDVAANRTMSPLDNYKVDYTEANPIIGNRYDQPADRDFEVTIPGDWASKGRVCVRQVDPLHFEILAFTPDIEVERR